jgi:hypothetical protein
MLRSWLVVFVLLALALTVNGNLTVIPLISTETNNFSGIDIIVHDNDAWAISATISPHPATSAVFGSTLLQWSKAEGFVFDQIELIPGAEG